MARERTVFSGLEHLQANDALALGALSLTTKIAPAVAANLRGRSCAIVTNHTGHASDGATSQAIITKFGARVRALFSPEHGFGGDQEGDVESTKAHGLVCHSLYGAHRRPTAEMLQGIDTVIFDLQDCGARFYTYSTTLCYLVEACAVHGLPLVVLDRPNPLGGQTCEGPLVDADKRSFVGYAEVPVRHGLTLGELALFHRDTASLDVDVQVVTAPGWQRSMQWPATGLIWPQPSPNLPDFEAVTWYPGTCLLEFCDLSVGRGTSNPFAVFGAPWLEPQSIIDDSASWPAEVLQDIVMAPCDFTPERATHMGTRCHGLKLRHRGTASLQPVAVGMALLASLCRTHSSIFDEAQMDRALPLLGSVSALQCLKSGDIAAALQLAGRDSANFERRREPFLLYC